MPEHRSVEIDTRDVVTELSESLVECPELLNELAIDRPRDCGRNVENV